jgi:hypothetical protein
MNIPALRALRYAIDAAGCHGLNASVWRIVDKHRHHQLWPGRWPTGWPNPCSHCHQEVADKTNTVGYDVGAWATPEISVFMPLAKVTLTGLPAAMEVT